MQKRYIREAWVQMELYRKLVNLGYEIYPEVKIKWCRVDLAIYYQGKIVCVIEVKNRKKKFKVNPGTKQYNKYADLGIPFTYCLSRHHIDETIKHIVKKYPLPEEAQVQLEHKIKEECRPLNLRQSLGI